MSTLSQFFGGGGSTFNISSYGGYVSTKPVIQSTVVPTSTNADQTLGQLVTTSTFFTSAMTPFDITPVNISNEKGGVLLWYQISAWQGNIIVNFYNVTYDVNIDGSNWLTAYKDFYQNDWRIYGPYNLAVVGYELDPIFFTSSPSFCRLYASNFNFRIRVTSTSYIGSADTKHIAAKFL